MSSYAVLRPQWVKSTYIGLSCVKLLAGEYHRTSLMTLQWRHNGRDGVLNNQPHDCLLNRLFRDRSKKTPKLHVTGLCAGIHRWTMNSPHKWPETRKMFPFDDSITRIQHWSLVIAWANFDPDMSPYGVTRPQWVNQTYLSCAVITCDRPFLQLQNEAVRRKLHNWIKICQRGTTGSSDGLTHLPLVPHLWVSGSGQHWLR